RKTDAARPDPDEEAINLHISVPLERTSRLLLVLDLGTGHHVRRSPRKTRDRNGSKISVNSPRRKQPISWRTSPVPVIVSAVPRGRLGTGMVHGRPQTRLGRDRSG